GGFALAEGRSRSPMMPLELFRSRVFSGVNLLTLLLYGALGGAFFFYPFLLIQARGYSAAAAGAAYLPFTLVMGVLARWGCGRIRREPAADRGARHRSARRLRPLLGAAPRELCRLARGHRGGARGARWIRHSADAGEPLG